MEYFVKSGNPEKQRVACVIVGIYDRRSPSDPAEVIDKAADGLIGGIMRRGDMDGKLGSTLVLHNVPGVFADRVLLVGLGKQRDFDETAFRKANVAAARALRGATGAIDAVSYLTHLEVKGRDFHWNVQQATLVTEDAYYRFDAMKGAQAREALPAYKLERLTFDVPRRSDLPSGEKGLAEALAIAKGVALAKDLGNLPGNVCTPSYLAETGLKLAAESGGLISTRILEEADMEKLGMGSLLSVSRGSRQPAKLIVMEYRQGPAGEKPVALVGKGLTFDAGGISLKPGAKMDEMKFDMCGGASVFGTFKALSLLKLPINVVAVVAASENLPDGQASKPGDIVTSMAGITIEVLNTDAEGRLILCDALTYTERSFDPAVCIDMATLTGACVMALGQFPSGLFSNTPGLARALLNAGEQIGDRAWELPLWPEYEENIRSEFADIANIATKGEGGGAIIGATFLHKFTKKMKWAHLDIAGTAWLGKKGTGRPVPLLTQYLLNYAAKEE
ncbi:leucyl aminopeptidase [Stagnimonas aquatica]|uniref:Probable cytosol aminopeptidase n=1 Tax=Stagnimonas aquatica TaxID=2689987 RepID=A0A3N0V608_9GAMM|nr:leucyl aminopeptidase [Stagnimonas aquatica]ROH87888.1 leucyl aminopeptidase [Stagnimonas aquatica]